MYSLCDWLLFEAEHPTAAGWLRALGCLLWGAALLGFFMLLPFA